MNSGTCHNEVHYNHTHPTPTHNDKSSLKEFLIMLILETHIFKQLLADVNLNYCSPNDICLAMLKCILELNTVTSFNTKG